MLKRIHLPKMAKKHRIEDYWKEFPKYQDYTSREQYEDDGVEEVTPMTAKEVEDDVTKDELFNNPNYIIEEKFDGTRATMHFYKNGCRIFSRRVSVKTNWFCENSDSLPQLRDLVLPEYADTVIDGELFIPNRPFKDVAGVLNCTYDKAIARQKELGYVVLHAFDIVFYKGEDVRNRPLSVRKKLLEEVVSHIDFYLHTKGYKSYVELVPYYKCGGLIPTEINWKLVREYQDNLEFGTLLKELLLDCDDCEGFLNDLDVEVPEKVNLTPKAYYEHTVLRGGEGVMLKPFDGVYEYKRTKYYLKVKKFLTRECVLVGFTEPTKLYEGKFPTFDSWEYWESKSGIKIHNSAKVSKRDISIGEIYPVTKNYWKGLVGNIVFGVVVTDDEYKQLSQGKKFKQMQFTSMKLEGATNYSRVLIVGECSGISDEERSIFTRHREKFIGSCIEVKANEIFKDTGKLRHPRFLRVRRDKSPSSCTWTEHISSF